LTGKTSKLSKTVIIVYAKVIGFDGDGKIVNYSLTKKTIENTVKMSTKLLTFIDMGGDTKYIKFLVPGFLSQYPVNQPIIFI
jgi:GTPase